MYTHNRLVTISIDEVTQAVNNLIYTSSAPKDTDLLYLHLVDAILQDSKISPSVDQRRFVLEKVITDLLVNRFHYLNMLFQITPPLVSESYQEALTSITHYGMIGNAELTGWCWVYYRYVRSELAITTETFSQLCHITGRTLRRYQRFALKQLTNLLIKAELQLNH